MKTCCITGVPFYGEQQVIAIPVIVRNQKVRQSVANDNVHPLPIAFTGVYNFDTFYPNKDERFDLALKAISSLVGDETSWDEFEMFAVNNQKIIYDNREYSFGMFFCYKHVFDNIISNLELETLFNKTPEKFSDFKLSLKHYIFNNSVFKLCEQMRTPVPFSERLPVFISSDFAIPSSFSESDLDYYSEVRFLNYFLNLTAKQWTVSVEAPEEKNDLAMRILADSFNVAISSI